jgi:hypothetical protein
LTLENTIECTTDRHQLFHDLFVDIKNEELRVRGMENKISLEEKIANIKRVWVDAAEKGARARLDGALTHLITNAREAQVALAEGHVPMDTHNLATAAGRVIREAARLEEIVDFSKSIAEAMVTP